jgi:mevalonate kinase
LSDRVVNDLAYEVEKLHHGTPSGVDNTVIAYQQPVYYVRGSPIETLSVPAPFTFLIADTGIPSPTSITVGDVRKSYHDNPSEYAKMFAAIGKLVESARGAIERGDLQGLGNLMDENHRYLSKLGVSSPELDRLVAIARQAGALGAKLSGGGRGGNMIALVVAEMAPQVVDALERGGAVNTITSQVESNAESRDVVAGGA